MDEVTPRTPAQALEALDAGYARFLEDLIQAREQVLKNQGDGGFVKITGEESEGAEAVCPIIAEGDAIGAVILLGKEPRGRMGETEKVLVKCAAGFLGRQMEQ